MWIRSLLWFYFAREIFWNWLLDIVAMICLHMYPTCYSLTSSFPLFSGNEIYAIKIQFYFNLKEEEKDLLVTYLLKIFAGAQKCIFEAF